MADIFYSTITIEYKNDLRSCIDQVENGEIKMELNSANDLTFNSYADYVYAQSENIKIKDHMIFDFKIYRQIDNKFEKEIIIKSYRAEDGELYISEVK